jgi:hypothetical protein
VLAKLEEVRVFQKLSISRLPVGKLMKKVSGLAISRLIIGCPPICVQYKKKFHLLVGNRYASRKIIFGDFL